MVIQHELVRLSMRAARKDRPARHAEVVDDLGQLSYMIWTC